MSNGRKKIYEFEKIYDPNTTQEIVKYLLTTVISYLLFSSLSFSPPSLFLPPFLSPIFSCTQQVFEDTRPIITSCADGYNVCIIAYGQTGAGKTYTMMGPRDNPGVNVRSIQELFRIMKDKDKTEFEMKVRAHANAYKCVHVCVCYL